MSIHSPEEFIFGTQQSHVDHKTATMYNVVKLNPDEDKCYLLTPYPTLMQPLKYFSSESIRAVARNPNWHILGIKIRHSTSTSNRAISRITNKTGHNTTTIQRSKSKRTCRNSRLFRHIRTRL